MKKLFLLVALTITAMQSHAATSTGTSQPTLEQLLGSTFATISIELSKLAATSNSSDWQNIIAEINNLIQLLSTPNSSESVGDKIIQSIHDIADIIQDIKALNSATGIQASVTASIGTPTATQISQTSNQ